jgi:AraC-like DNA-binding protein
MGPSELARTLRLRRAYDLLVDTRQPISEVALDTGFADGSHFSRRFRDAFGKSPSEARREAARPARGPESHPEKKLSDSDQRRPRDSRNLAASASTRRR